MRNHGRYLLVVAAALILGAAACARAGARGPAPARQPPTILHVENQTFLDMDIFVLREAGDRLRLGFVTSNSSANLTIPPSVIFGVSALRFIADPVGGTRASVSQQIAVTAGDTVVMTIPNY